MKLKFVFVLIILLALIAIFNNVSTKEMKENFKPLELEIGDEFTGGDYDSGLVVINYAVGDVTGDGKNDMIIIIGKKDDTFATDVDIVIYDAKDDKFISGDLKKCSVKAPKIYLNDINGDGICDVILIGENEDNTKNVRILTLLNGESKEIFKVKDNKGLTFTGKFVDGFKANIVARSIKFERTIELDDKKQNYVTSGFYDESGRVTASKNSISTSNFIEVEFVELSDYNGIKTTQRIKGFDNLDILDIVTVIWKYEDGKWNIKEAKSEKMGNLLY